MNQKQTPIIDALNVFRDKERYSFHVPGHKSGRVLPEQGSRYFREYLSIDATEIEGLDDLYAPTGVIKEAQSLLSDFYQTRQSFFLVNGSTVGNLVMVLSSCEPGDTFLVQRNAHRSIFNALKLAGARAVLLDPESDSFSKMAVGLSLNTVQGALKRFPEAKALVLTYPNYYGETTPILNVIQEVKREGLGVLVDEAHGPHFKWGDPFPKSSLEFGADLVVHSAHKMLPAMTMGGYLHLNSDWVREEHILQTLKMLQTSSPSYPLMASLDLARSFLGTLKPDQMSRVLGQIDSFKEGLRQLGFETSPTMLRMNDPLKVMIQRQGYSGFEIKKRFESIGLFPEMADPLNLLLVFGLDEHPPLNDILEAIRELEWESRSIPIYQKMGKSILEISSHPILFSRKPTVTVINKNLEEAEGYKAGEDVSPYPPGIPVLIQGETITRQHIDSLLLWEKEGARIQGLYEYENNLWLKVFS